MGRRGPPAGCGAGRGPGALAQLPPTHTGRKFSLGAPVYHTQSRDGDTDGEVPSPPSCYTGTQLGLGPLSALESWRWTHLGFLWCSDLFARMGELSIKICQSLGQVNGWRKECPKYTEVFSFASEGRETEVHAFPRSWSTSATSRARVWHTLLRHLPSWPLGA